MKRRPYMMGAKPRFALVVIMAASLVAQSQTIITNFTGLTLSDVGSNLTPPDTMGCAGTNQFVEFINGAFAVYSKAGQRQSLVSDSSFWLSAGISSSTISAGLTDPRIQYDTGSGRWFASELTVDKTGNKILVGRSDSSNPSGTWKAVSFIASTNEFGDFDTLGVDSQGVYLTVNVFNATGTTMTGVSVFSIPKADLTAATPTLANMTRFDNLNPNTYGFAIQGVNNPDAGRGHGVLVAIDYQFYNQFERATINNPGGPGATLSSATIIHNAYDGTPNPPVQAGGSTVDGGDDRFSGAARQIGGYIFFANAILNTNNNRDAVHWLVLNETNNAVASEGIVTDPNFDFTYPSIAASHSGKVLMAFNRIGTNAPAGDISIYAVLGTVTNGVVTMGSPFLLKQGTVSNYTGIGPVDPTPHRWGDYSATMFDPTDDNLVWTIQEIPSTSTAWGTQITLISVTTNRPALGIAPAQYAFSHFYTNRNNQVVAVSNLVSVQLSWPLSTDPAFGLQSSTNLANAAAWTALTNPPLVSINQNLVTVPVTNGAAFFRLKK